MPLFARVSPPGKAAVFATVYTVAFLLIPASGGAQQSLVEQGEDFFRLTCLACHTVGGGRLIGPDLRGVTERRSEAWLIDFIQHSQAIIQSGDAEAVALAADYPGLIMPDAILTDDEIRAVLTFTSEGTYTPFAVVAAAPATASQILHGQDLFQGTARLANGGPTCTSCHDVTNDAVIGGGILAVELTTVFTRLGGAGVRAILGSPPFPVMQRAYQDKPLTEDEVVSLVGFLEQANAQQAFHLPSDYGIKLFGAGLLGATMLMGLYSLMWSGRLRGSVNQAIYDRQVKST